MKQPLIAIADDHDQLRNGLSGLLKMLGFEIALLARNGLELISTLKTSKALPQLCIVDIKMPEMNGYETTKAIKQLWPDMKVVLFSFETGKLTEAKAMECGADWLLYKGGDFWQIEQELKILCTRG